MRGNDPPRAVEGKRKTRCGAPERSTLSHVVRARNRSTCPSWRRMVSQWLNGRWIVEAEVWWRRKGGSGSRDGKTDGVSPCESRKSQGIDRRLLGRTTSSTWRRRKSKSVRHQNQRRRTQETRNCWRREGELVIVGLVRVDWMSQVFCHFWLAGLARSR